MRIRELQNTKALYILECEWPDGTKNRGIYRLVFSLVYYDQLNRVEEEIILQHVGKKVHNDSHLLESYDKVHRNYIKGV